jgi:opacity protein-like surface antigen
MKKIQSIIICTLFVLVIFNNKANAQLHISLGPAIGYTIPSGDFGGSPGDYYNGTKYGLSSGIDFGAMGRLGLGPLNFQLSLLYTPLSNTGSVPDPNPGSTVDIKMHLFTIAVGTQYGFGVPLAPVKPYIGIDLLFTTISGSFQFHGTQKVNSNSNDLNSATRVGLGISGGVNIKLLTTSLDVSLRYNLINLFSKRYEGSPTGDRIDSYLFLNDDKDPNYSTASNDKHPIGSSRIIATIQLQLGVMFGL